MTGLTTDEERAQDIRLLNEAKVTQGYSDGDLRSLIRSFAEALERHVLPRRVTPVTHEGVQELIVEARKAQRLCNSNGEEYYAVQFCRLANALESLSVSPTAEVRSATCPVCGVTVTDQTPSEFYLWHDENCSGELNEPEGASDD